jgi:hypothetical protein
MADNSYQNIEDVKIGDLVKSYNFKTCKIVNREVTDVFHHDSDEMADYYLIVNDYLKVTPNHRFYNKGIWMTFDKLKLSDMIGNIPIYSIEKIHNKVPTFDLEIEGNHNYLVNLYDNSFIAHNKNGNGNGDKAAGDDKGRMDLGDFPANIDPRSWVIANKHPYPRQDIVETFKLEPYGDYYFVEYTYVGTDGVSDYYIYEIKEKKDYLYTIIDYEKIIGLNEVDIPYEDAISLLGLDDEKFIMYDFNINIRNESDVVWRYGASYVVPNVESSVSRDVIIYYPPRFRTPGSPDLYDLIEPYYECGQITVELILGGIKS